MPNLSIKNVPEATVTRLRQRAQRNHRSLQGELMALLEQALSASSKAPGRATVAHGDGRDDCRDNRRDNHRKSIDQIVEEHRRRGSAISSVGGRAADLIRTERDGR